MTTTQKPWDISLLKHHDRFYVIGETDQGKAWIRRKLDMPAGDNISTEFLSEYEAMIIKDGLRAEVITSG